jgi:hypothetical protein
LAKILSRTSEARLGLSSTTYVGVTAFRYVMRTRNKGRTYYYFRRRTFPIVRLPGEPGSVIFTAVYEAALEARTCDELMALRTHMPKQRQRCEELHSPSTNAIMLWASRKPITLEQATMVAKRFGVSVDEITRNREIVPKLNESKK